jgi:DNA-binding MarR family transcriptional regulator
MPFAGAQARMIYVVALVPNNCLDNYRLAVYTEDMTTLTPAAETARQRFDSLEQEVFLNVWRTYDRLRSFEDELFSAYDLTPQQYNALRLLRAAHPNKLATLDLAARLVSRAPDITRLLDKLEQRGLIERDRPQENRRMVRIGITAAGLTLLQQLHEPLQECHRKQLGHLSRKALRQLTALLREARAPHEEKNGNWR